jgi:hypothetical protein
MATGVVIGGGLGVRAALFAIGVALGVAGLAAFLDEKPVEDDAWGAPLPVELRDPVERAAPATAPAFDARDVPPPSE